MTITTSDLADKKAYLKAVQSTTRASAKGPFLYYETKYADGNKARLLVFGTNLAELKKHLESKKATLLDEGQIGKGAVFAGKRGKLDTKALEALGLADLASVADDESESSGSESESESASGSDSPRSSGSKAVDANAIVPSLGKPVRIMLATVIAGQKKAAALQHPELRKQLTQKAEYLIGLLTKGDLNGFARPFGEFEQMLSDSGLVGEIGAELAQIEPVAKAHRDTNAAELFKSARKLYDEGNLLMCRGLIAQFNKKYGHNPYEVKATGEAKAMADLVAQAGTLADAYEKTKSELEAKVDKALADTKKYAVYADEAKKLKTYFAKTATLGLRKQIKEIENEADAAKRRSKVEKAILSTQAYLTAGEQIKGPALSIDYFKMLRHLHAKLSELHH